MLAFSLSEVGERKKVKAAVSASWIIEEGTSWSLM